MTPDKMGGGEPLLVVPDVHLRIEPLRSLLDAWSDSGPVVFLGDFFDDFGDTRGRNREMAEFLKDEILPKPRHTVLMGNHDLHYSPWCPSELWCSGFHPDKKEAIGEVLGVEEFAHFKWAHSWGGILFTHAGLHPRLIPPLSSGKAEELSGWIGQSCVQAIANRDPSEPLLRAGRARGGYQPVGGVIWMDAREYQPIEGLRQIFGHTPLHEPMELDARSDGSWCIDTNLQCAAVIRATDREVRIVNVGGITREDIAKACGRSLSKTHLGGGLTRKKCPSKRDGIR